MKKIKLTYRVIANENPFAQKTVTAKVANNSNAFSEFESIVRNRLGENVRFNHAGKVVAIQS
jgi:hypothetical protein